MEIWLIILWIYSFSITVYLIFMKHKKMYHDKVSIWFIFWTDNKQHYILFNWTHFETSLSKKEWNMIWNIKVWSRWLDKSETKVIVDNYNWLINKTWQ